MKILDFQRKYYIPIEYVRVLIQQALAMHGENCSCDKCLYFKAQLRKVD